MSHPDTPIWSCIIMFCEWEVTMWGETFRGYIKNPEKIKEAQPEKSQQIYIDSISHNVTLYI